MSGGGKAKLVATTVASGLLARLVGRCEGAGLDECRGQSVEDKIRGSENDDGAGVGGWRFGGQFVISAWPAWLGSNLHHRRLKLLLLLLLHSAACCEMVNRDVFHLSSALNMRLVGGR